MVELLFLASGPCGYKKCLPFKVMEIHPEKYFSSRIFAKNWFSLSRSTIGLRYFKESFRTCKIILHLSTNGINSRKSWNLKRICKLVNEL
jgi:hypothetical protein